MLKELTPMKAIRMRCYECAGSAREITLCPVTGCPLMRFVVAIGQKKSRCMKQAEKVTRQST